MIRKLLFSIIIGLSFLFFFKTEVINATCTSNLEICKYALGDFKPTCCRSNSCSSPCGPLNKWEYCYASQCCYFSTGKNCVNIGSYTYCEIKYVYLKRVCSTADSCRNTKYLQPGLCLDSGCAKGGDYKICCTYPYDGTTCPNACIGGNTTGTCPSGCRNPGPNQLSCPTGAAPPTPTPQPGVPTPTPKPGATPTPAPPPGATPIPGGGGGSITIC